MMDKIKRTFWGACTLLLDGYAVCVALLAANPHIAFWLVLALLVIVVL